MSKQIKVLVGSLVAGAAVFSLFAGSAFAEDGKKCGCCKDMAMPMPTSTSK